MGLAVLGALAGAGLAAGYRINLTPSEPLGLWRVWPATTAPRRGDTVSFCAPVPEYPFLDRGICPRGLMPFLKEIVGVPGDRIVETDRGVTVNGMRLPHSRPHRMAVGYLVRLPRWRGRMMLKPGVYWTYGSHDPRWSFDSRYWGPLARTRIRFLARPVWTVGG
ncbi:MAG: S26 family signal peptidase [Sulfobacillus sp.]